MDSGYALIFAIICPAVVGALSMALPRPAISLRVWACTAAPLVTLLLLGWHFARHGNAAAPASIDWMPSLQLSLSFQPDRLGLFFASLVAAVGVLITLYARAYFGPDQNALFRIYPSLLLFMTGMLGLVLADNLILMLLFWELTSISSFLLIGWERDDPQAVRNALQAFIVTGSGGIALLGGVILLGTATGAWSFTALAASGDVSGWKVTAAFLLIFFAVATKSAQWPLHFWLPGAMAAPTPISAYLHSATMVKAGVYLLARLADPLAQLALWPPLLIPIGTVTMVLGAYLALRKTDLKLIFAYTTVSQLGLFVCMYGLSPLGSSERPALLWDVTQILNHALYKAPLFILAGAIAHLTYTRDLRDLYGLFYQGRSERRLAILMLLAAYAMAAGPLTLSFTAKEFFLYGLYNAYKNSGNLLLVAVMLAAFTQAMLNVAIFIRIALTLLGPETAEVTEPPHDPEAEEERIAYEDYHAIQHGFWLTMLWLPAALLLAVQFLGGVAPALLDPALKLIEPNRVRFQSLPGLWYALTHPSVPLAMSLSATVAGVALAVLPGRFGFPPVWRRSIRDWHDLLFPAFYRLVTRGGGRVFDLLQTGNLRHYLFVICGSLALLTGWAVISAGAVPELSSRTLDEPARGQRLVAYATGALVCLAALLMPFTQRRAGRVMILGTVGFGVTALFYVYNAPDVALTQVTIEIVSLILFLLALGLLPRTVSRPREVLVGSARIVLAVAVGAAMFWLTLVSSLQQRPPLPLLNAEGKPFAHLGEFFLRNSYAGQDVIGRHPGGGGNNVVNVILVDFRGLDTFGEITVLAIAALGVFALLHRRSRPARADATPPETTTQADAADQAPAEPAPHHLPWSHRLSLSSEPLRVVAKLLVPLSLLFALFIFLKGHQTPGGGFVAGLVAAIALIAHRMAQGRASLRHMMRAREHTVIAAGLLLAMAAGVGPLLLGRPFLTSRFGYLQLPGTDDQVEWTTVLVFDLGVFLVVLGVVLAMINAMSKESEGR
jgi:NADH:ubiquinone oxidoreductase subunit 5 (subunit L)/multisubunit Na+/H+ antiporter MnhA subunit/multisubunit Na+/H+ antiporter MnhB subunit